MPPRKPYAAVRELRLRGVLKPALVEPPGYRGRGRRLAATTACKGTARPLGRGALASWIATSGAVAPRAYRGPSRGLVPELASLFDALRPFASASQFVGRAGSRPACRGPRAQPEGPQRGRLTVPHVGNPTSVLALVQPALAQAEGLRAHLVVRRARTNRARRFF